MNNRNFPLDSGSVVCRSALWMLSLVLINACSSSVFNPPIPGRLNLLSPAEGPAAVLLKQKVTFITEDRRQQFLAVTGIDPRKLELVVLLATGQKILSMSYDGSSFKQNQHLSKALPGEEIMALIQFVHWPEDAIRRHYRQRDGWMLEFADVQRSLLTRAGLSLRVDYNVDNIMVVNYQHHYRIVIEPI